MQDRNTECAAASFPLPLWARLLWNTNHLGQQDLAEDSGGFAVLKQLSARCENRNQEQKM